MKTFQKPRVPNEICVHKQWVDWIHFIDRSA